VVKLPQFCIDAASAELGAAQPEPVKLGRTSHPFTLYFLSGGLWQGRFYSTVLDAIDFQNR
jgi:hypothetical protein